MIRKVIALVLATVLIHVSGAGARMFAQTVEAGWNQNRMEVGKAHAKKHKVDVKLPDGKKLTGNVTAFTSDSFVLRDKSGTDQSFGFADVVEVRKHQNTGKKILIGVGLGAAVGGILVACAVLRGCTS